MPFPMSKSVGDPSLMQGRQSAPVGDPLSALPPWDQTSYFGIPTEVDVTVGNTAVQLVKGDPLRSRLVIGVNTGGATINNNNILNLSLNSTITQNNGLALSVASSVIIITWDAWGVLVQQPWFAITSRGVTGNVNVAIQTVQFIRFPGYLNDVPLLEQTDNVSPYSGQRRPNNYSSKYRIGANRRSKPAQGEDSDIAALIKSCADQSGWACDVNIGVAPGSWGLSTGIR